MKREILAAQLRERRSLPPGMSDDQVIQACISGEMDNATLERCIATADIADKFLVLVGTYAEVRSLKRETPTTDELLWTAFQAGDVSALAEITLRWRSDLTDYVLHRVQDQQRASTIVDDVFQALAKSGSLAGQYIRNVLFATAHALTGATCDWRERMPVFSAQSPLREPVA